MLRRLTTKNASVLSQRTARTISTPAVAPISWQQHGEGQGRSSRDGSGSQRWAWQFAAGAAAAVAVALSGGQPLVAHCDGKSKEDSATIERSKQIKGIKLFTGNANKPLALEIAKQLDVTMGQANVGRFKDGEVMVNIIENIRGKDVFIVQPTSPPVNENLMELLLMISTMRRASARKITAVIPYYGYARQDRKMTARVPISAADTARLLEAMGVDRVIAVDLHCGQIQGFFRPRVPVDNLEGGSVGVEYFGNKEMKNPVIVSPDAGGVYRAKQFRERVLKKYDKDCGLAMIVKQRARANEIERMDLVGNVQGCDCILVDDMVDTAGTLCKAAEMLKEFGARNVYAFCSHGVLTEPAAQRINDSCLTELVVLDTIPLNEECKAVSKITQLSVGPLLAQAISNIHNNRSISALFK